jgi:hypothetical protein
MKDPVIPTPLDEALRLASLQTVTATAALAVPAAGVCDAGSGFAPNMVGEPMAFLVNTTAIKTSVGDETYTVKLQACDDNSTWVDVGTGQAFTLTAVGNQAVGFFAKHRYHRAYITIAGTLPTITVEAFVSPFVW